MQEKTDPAPTSARGARVSGERRNASAETSRRRSYVVETSARNAAKCRSERVFFLQSQNRDPTVNQFLASDEKFFVAEATPTRRRGDVR
jgi:hypothetical protein